jgi:hypothetical protein
MKQSCRCLLSFVAALGMCGPALVGVQTAR